MEKGERYIYAHPYLAYDKKKDEVRYLGYGFKLGKRELAVLKAIMLSEGGADKETISAFVAIGTELSSQRISRIVCEINKKSVAAGGRSIIKLGKDKKYVIEEFI